MDSTQRGKLVLKTVPDEDVEKKVVRLLLEFAKTASVETLTEKVKHAPYVLSSDIEAEKALMFIDALQKFGATAVFMPHATARPTAEKLTPVQKPPAISFDSPPADEAAPVPIRKKSKKNGSRRFTLILVIILLCLSFGYLTWQLWPIIGVKIQEIINFLKHNV